MTSLTTANNAADCTMPFDVTATEVERRSAPLSSSAILLQTGRPNNRTSSFLDIRRPSTVEVYESAAPFRLDPAEDRDRREDGSALWTDGMTFRQQTD